MQTVLVLGIVLVACVGLYVWMTAPGAPAPKWLTEYPFAHRGLHDNRHPENSLAAFEYAIQRKVAIELDVRLSKDGEVVVFHDSMLQRMTGQAGSVADKTAMELNQMSLNATKHTIPTLSQVLGLVQGRVPLLIEIKSEGRAGKIEPAVYKLLSSYKGRYAIQSFSPLSIRWFLKNAPHTIIGQLSANFKENADHIPRVERFFVKNLLINFLSRPQFISYQLSALPQKTLTRIKHAGVPVLVWTITTEGQLREAQKTADSIIFENEQLIHAYNKGQE